MALTSFTHVTRNFLLRSLTALVHARSTPHWPVAALVVLAVESSNSSALSEYTMRAFQKFATQHDDFIHDLSYDFYGKRLATCSSDQKIKVWDLNDRNEWVLSAEWKAHAGSIWKVEWAHPEFGQILASCSFDRTVCIWEEQEDIDGSAKWQLKATLLDSKGSVQDVKFAPRHLGLKLATCSTDGIVRIYEAIDVTNLSHWSLMEEFEAQKGTSVCAINAVAWNPSPFEKPMLVVGTDEHSAKIWEYNELQRRWVTIETLHGHKGAIHDVDWAPNVGRSYYLLATASKDCTVRVWQLESKVPSDAKSSGEVKQQTASSSALSVSNVWPLEAHKSEVWRVEWNMTGTVLASSGDDGTVHLWKSLTVPSGNHLAQQWVSLAAINTNS